MENSEEFREGTENGCKAKMRKVFHNPITHLIIIAFIVLDIAILLVVLLVDINVIQVRAETEEDEEHLREELEDGLHYAALTIISLFVVEVFDAIVIFVTFGLDLALAFSPVSSAVRDSVALLVFLRLWRVVKIMTGVTFGGAEQLTGQLHLQNTQIQQ
uniref:Voltage-gated hydrogen channel 1 n=1 Tax=Magallana gigas TaxID=29159 RepID=K1RIY7_MAGGI